MNKHVIIYDAINAGTDWNNDIVDRFNKDKEVDASTDIMVIGRRGFNVSISEEIVDLLTKHLLSFAVVDSGVDIAIYIGNYIHSGFKLGLFPAESHIEVVTECTNVETAVVMATMLSAEHIKPEDKFKVTVDRVVLQNGTKRICYTKPRTIFGADPDSEGR